MGLSLRAAAQSISIGCLGGILAAAVIASWHATAMRTAVCRAAVVDIAGLTAGRGHIDPDSGSSWLSAPDVELLFVNGDAAAVHGARCGFSAASLLLPRPVLQSLAVDDLLISPIRLKLLGIALGVRADPVAKSG